MIKRETGRDIPPRRDYEPYQSKKVQSVRPPPYHRRKTPNLNIKDGLLQPNRKVYKYTSRTSTESGEEEK